MTRSIVFAIVAMLLGCGNESPERLLASAHGYLAQDDAQSAMIQLRNALQQRPDDGTLRLLLGQTLLHAHDPGSAEKELRKALQYGQPKNEVLPLLARAMLQGGRSAALIDAFGAEELSVPQAEAQLKVALGEAHLQLGHAAAAASAFGAAEAAVTGYLAARIGHARVSAIEGNLLEAARHANQLASEYPSSPEAHALVADMRSLAGDRIGAAAALNEALRINPKYLVGRYALTQMFISENQFDAAAAELDKARKLAKGDLRISYLDAAIAFGRDDLAKARESLQWVLKHSPEHVPTLILAAAVELQSGQPYAADSMLRQAVALAPQNTEARKLLIGAHLELAERALRNNDLQSAAALYKAVIDRDPDSFVALNNLAWAAGQLNDPNALGYARRAVSLNPDNAAALDTLGALLVQNGDEAKGVEALRKAISLAPNRPDIRFNYAKALIKSGQKNAARVELKALLATGGDFADKAEAAAMLKGL